MSMRTRINLLDSPLCFVRESRPTTVNFISPVSSCGYYFRDYMLDNTEP